MAKPTTEVAVKDTAANLPSVIDFSADAGAGFEETDASSYAIPFLRQLQMMSSQCKKTDPNYIKGAEEGDFFNTVTEKLYKGDEGVIIIPCHYIHKYNLWAPDRGGFRGTLSVTEYATTEKRQGDKGEIDASGNSIQDSREHYVLVIEEDGTTAPALLALGGTQLKKSKKWMTLLDGICQRKKPMFSQKFKLTAMSESNDKGSWAGVKIEHAGELTDVDQYMAAKQFATMVRAGDAKAAPIDGDDLAF